MDAKEWLKKEGYPDSVMTMTLSNLENILIRYEAALSEKEDGWVDEAAEKLVIELMEKEPGKAMMWMMIQMGKMVIETNAGSMDIKQESN